MTIEEIENDLNRGIYLNNYSNVEQAISFLLSEVKRLDKDLNDVSGVCAAAIRKRIELEAEVKRLREGIQDLIGNFDNWMLDSRLEKLLEDK